MKECEGANPLGCCATEGERAGNQAWTLNCQAPLLLGLSGSAVASASLRSLKTVLGHGGGSCVRQDPFISMDKVSPYLTTPR